MGLRVVKIGDRRGDTPRYIVEGLGDLDLCNLDGVPVTQMWSFNVARVLAEVEGMSDGQISKELARADREYDKRLLARGFRG
jgi:hypothetical protein